MHQRNISSAFIALSVLVSVLCVTPANAVLVGTQIGVAGTDILSTINPSSSITVNGQGTEDFQAGRFGPPPFPGFPPPFLAVFSVDVFDTGMELTALNDDSLTLATLSFTDLNWGGTGALTNVSISRNDIQGGTTSILFDPITNPTAFTIEFSNITLAGDETVSIALTPSHPIPTPSAMLLMGTGIAALIGWNYRKGKKS